MPNPSISLIVAIGIAAGILSGVFGIGGGVIIVPALIYLAGFRQHSATGTSLAVLLPPIGLGAMWEYYREGNVNVRVAMIMAVAVFVGGWIGAKIANRVSGPYLRLAFGVFVVGLGVSLIFGALRRRDWRIWTSSDTALSASSTSGTNPRAESSSKAVSGSPACCASQPTIPPTADRLMKRSQSRRFIDVTRGCQLCEGRPSSPHSQFMRPASRSAV